MNSLNIKQRRESVGLTQAQFASEISRRAGRKFSQQSLQRFESNVHATSGFTHIMLDILEELENKGKAIYTATTPEEKELFELVSLIKEQGKTEAVKKYLQFVAQQPSEKTE